MPPRTATKAAMAVIVPYNVDSCVEILVLTTNGTVSGALLVMVPSPASVEGPTKVKSPSCAATADEEGAAVEGGCVIRVVRLGLVAVDE